ncbi:MAG TPA: N-acetyltransferase, partial [Anaerolineales bacterium]|nr:N-acetyltransferase [Anaerolineales bacterium]
GLPFVWRYYQIAQMDPQVIGLCAVSAASEIFGWAMGSPHPDRITSQLRSPLAWFVPQMLRITLTRPLVLWQLMSSLFSASSHAEIKDGMVELTYIGVAADQRGKRLGERLLLAFIETSRSHGYYSVVLSVENENSSAISLYKKVGFKVIDSFSEGRYRRHRMELRLA